MFAVTPQQRLLIETNPMARKMAPMRCFVGPQLASISSLVWLVQLDPRPKRPARFNGLNDGWLRRLGAVFVTIHHFRGSTSVNVRLSVSRTHGLMDSWTGSVVSGPGWCATDRDGG